MNVATGKKQMVTAKYTSVLYAMLLLKILFSEFYISTSTAQKVNIWAWHFHRSIFSDENLKKIGSLGCHLGTVLHIG